MRRRNLFKLFTDAGCVFVADKEGQRGMIRAQERHRNLPGHSWKDTLGFKLIFLNLRIFRAIYGFIKKKTLRRIAKKSNRVSFLREIESRADIILWRSGLVPNVWKARQLINHGHVNKNKVKVLHAGTILSPGDILEIGSKYRSSQKYPLTRKIFNKKPEHLEIDYASYRTIYLFHPNKFWFPGEFDYDYVWKGLVV